MGTTTIAIIILVLSFAVFLMLRFPVALTLSLATILTIMYLKVPLEVVGQRMIQGVNAYALLTIPFFILAGQIMSEGGLALRLVNLAMLAVGRIRGGLALVNVVACLFFGNISGSAAADVSSIGSIMIPTMKKKGYDDDYTVGLTVAASVQGVVVPPSHNLILYSLAAGGTSIAALFMAGVIPGIVMAIALMIASYFMARRRGYQMTETVNRKDIPRILFDGLLSIMPAVIILGGIFSGWFTATESGALACLYAFVITFFYYREIPISRMWLILKRTFRTVSMVLFLIASSAAFSWLLAFLKIPSMITDTLLHISHNPAIILLIINALLLLLGAPMDMAPLILIMTPILLPVVTSLGMNPVHFGIVMMLNLGLGLITPPVGTVLFIGCAIGKISIGQGTRAMLPFFAVLVGVLLLITYVPQIVMWLPGLMKS